MKALRFHAPEDVRLEDVPEPECKPDEIKIKVRNCSTCGTDVKTLTMATRTSPESRPWAMKLPERSSRSAPR